MAEEPKHPAVVAFIETLMVRTGTTTPAELRAHLGEPWTTNRDQERKLYKWHRGETAPNFYSTLELLRAAGMLSEQGEAVAASSSRRADQARSRLEELEATLARQGRATSKALAGIEGQLGDIRDLLAPPGREATEDR